MVVMNVRFSHQSRRCESPSEATAESPMLALELMRGTNRIHWRAYAMPSARPSVERPTQQQAKQPQIVPRLLTIPQAAVYLAATVWAVRALLWSRKIPHVVIGKRHLIDRGDLDRFIDRKLNECGDA
jgi:excisionase family DNA binding protein